MRKLLLVLLALSLMAILVPAQDDAPLFQVNGGWLYNRYGSLNMYKGFDVGFTYWMNNYFGITGDFSGNYANYPDYYGQQLAPDKLDFYNYLFGIKLASWDNENFVPFTHFLLGAGSSITKYPAQGGGIMSHTETAFAYAIGGGVISGYPTHLVSPVHARLRRSDRRQQSATRCESPSGSYSASVNGKRSVFPGSSNRGVPVLQITPPRSYIVLSSIFSC